MLSDDISRSFWSATHQFSRNNIGSYSSPSKLWLGAHLRCHVRMALFFFRNKKIKEFVRHSSLVRTQLPLKLVSKNRQLIPIIYSMVVKATATTRTPAGKRKELPLSALRYPTGLLPSRFCYVTVTMMTNKIDQISFSDMQKDVWSVSRASPKIEERDPRTTFSSK